MTTLYLDEETVATKIREWVDEADVNELADLVGHIFKGNCWYMDEEFVLEVDNDFKWPFG